MVMFTLKTYHVCETNSYVANGKGLTHAYFFLNLQGLLAFNDTPAIVTNQTRNVSEGEFH